MTKEASEERMMICKQAAMSRFMQYGVDEKTASDLFDTLLVKISNSKALVQVGKHAIKYSDLINKIKRLLALDANPGRAVEILKANKIRPEPVSLKGYFPKTQIGFVAPELGAVYEKFKHDFTRPLRNTKMSIREALRPAVNPVDLQDLLGRPAGIGSRLADGFEMLRTHLD